MLPEQSHKLRGDLMVQTLDKPKIMTNREKAEARVAEAKAAVIEAEAEVGVASFYDSIIEFLNENKDEMDLPDVDKDVNFKCIYNIEKMQFEPDYTLPTKGSPGGGTRVVMDWTGTRVAPPGADPDSATKLPMAGAKTPNWMEAMGEPWLLPKNITDVGSSINKIKTLRDLGFTVLIEGDEPDPEDETEDEELESGEVENTSDDEDSDDSEE